MSRYLAVIVGLFVAGYGLWQIDEPWLTFRIGACTALLAFGAGLPGKDTGAPTDG